MNPEPAPVCEVVPNIYISSGTFLGCWYARDSACKPLCTPIGQACRLLLRPDMKRWHLQTVTNTSCTTDICLQVVQNALVWSRLQYQPFTTPPSKNIPNNGYQGIDRLELRALWAIVAIEAALVVFFLALAVALMWVPCITACRQHKVRTFVTMSMMYILLQDVFTLTCRCWLLVFAAVPSCCCGLQIP